LRSCDVTLSGGEDIDIAQSGSNDVESAGAGAGSQAWRLALRSVS